MKILSLTQVVTCAQRLLVSPQEILAGLHRPSTLPVDDLQVKQRLDAAIDWMRLDHAMAGDDGISKGYDSLRGRCSPFYGQGGKLGQSVISRRLDI